MTNLLKNKSFIALLTLFFINSGVFAQELTETLETDADQPIEVTPSQAQPVSTTAIAPPDAEGVIPSVTHKGEITDFLKIFGFTCDKNIVPSQSVRGQIVVSLFDVTCKEVLDAVLTTNGFAYEEKGNFIYVYTAQELTDIQKAARRTVSRAFQLNYIPAADLSSLIVPLLSAEGQITTTPEASSDKSSGENWAGNNFMVVVDFPENIESVAKLIKSVDVRPPQVLIEATILVARVDDQNELGVDFNVLGGVDFQASNGLFHPGDATNVNLSGTSTSAGTGFNTNLTGGGLSIGVVKSNIGIFIEALESTTDVVTLGNPKVLTLNRQPAKVIVGKRDGYITTEVSQTTATQTVEFLETGTQLSFRPFVMQDGFIRMELNPKDSDGGVTVSGNFTLPSETTAEVTTNVLVKDGRTIVIGGLFRERTELNRSQVPGAGNLPLLGNLFRSTSDNNIKEEVIFLITPHIIKEKIDYAAADDVMQNINTLTIGLREGMQWHGRERLAASYYQKACELKDAGQPDEALKNAKMAANISPAFLDAINLRDELSARKIYAADYTSMKNFLKNIIQTQDELPTLPEPEPVTPIELDPLPETSDDADNTSPETMQLANQMDLSALPW